MPSKYGYSVSCEAEQATRLKRDAVSSIDESINPRHAARRNAVGESTAAVELVKLNRQRKTRNQSDNTRKMEVIKLNTHQTINYLEIPSCDIPSTKAFFSAAFDWTFEDYGPDYVAFVDAGLQGGGGFFNSDQIVSAERGSVLVVFYSKDLEATAEIVRQAGGSISKAIFDFPGGRRFHFCEPCGNEYAVWSDLTPQ